MTPPHHRPDARVDPHADDAHADPLVIDCHTCIGPSVGACDDCVVTFLLGREPDDAVVIDVGEARALRLLADAELVPHLRHEPAG